MADFNKFIPFVLKWAAGVTRQQNESLDSLFNRAKRSGWSNHPLDKGGPTQCDVTLTTYRTYCKRKAYPTPTEEALRHIPFLHWKEILKKSFWDLWQADRIDNQSLAELIVDWVWGSGGKSIRTAQKIIGVEADGIVGDKTISEINVANPKLLFSRLHVGRVEYVKSIVKRNPSQKIWLRGWLNRINDIKYRT